MTTTTTDTARAWVGCLACYNNGALVGAWVDALEAGAFIPCTRGGHDEFWVMDHEGLGMDSECSPSEAQAIAEALAKISEGYDLEAVTAYASNMGYSLSEFFDVWSQEFEDSYRGTWKDFEEFANDVCQNYGFLDNENNDSILRQYFDFEAWARDLEHDYFTYDVTNGLAIFQNI